MTANRRAIGACEYPQLAGCRAQIAAIRGALSSVVGVGKDVFMLERAPRRETERRHRLTPPAMKREGSPTPCRPLESDSPSRCRQQQTVILAGI
jgi:hypothetical protein